MYLTLGMTIESWDLGKKHLEELTWLWLLWGVFVCVRYCEMAHCDTDLN